MTAPPVVTNVPPHDPETLLTNHIAAMRIYASDLEVFLGTTSPIVKRIRVCAASKRWHQRQKATGEQQAAIMAEVKEQGSE